MNIWGGAGGGVTKGPLNLGNKCVEKYFQNLLSKTASLHLLFATWI